MQLVGIKELKDKLSYYIGLTKKGDQIIVTDRDVPVAILHSLDDIEENAGIDERLASLAKKGMLKIPSGKKKLRPFKSVKIKGKPLSATIIEERR